MKYQEIIDRLGRLAADRPRDIPDERLNRAREELRRRTPGSARLFQRAQRAIPGGVQHALAPTDPYPLFIERAEGSHLIDIDGNIYVDYVLGGGPVILGHNPPRLRERLVEVLHVKGPFHGLSDEYEVLAAEKIIRHMPSVERVCFLQSGTEAVMAAARLARAFTGRDKIIKFRGAYHGWADQFVTDMWVKGSGPLMAWGIPEEHRAHTVLVDHNDLDELGAAFKNHPDNVAAVFVEPLGAESGALPLMDGFHHEVKRLCQQHGALYVFDEVVTGFRLGLGGAQAYFNVDADLTILGKVIMSGYPSCGALGGRAEVIDALSPRTAGRGPSAFVAGTMAANPLSCAACYFTLLELEQTGAIEKAAAAADRLVADLNALFAREETCYFAHNFASVLHVETAAPLAFRMDAPGGPEEIARRKALLERYALVLTNEGVISLRGRGLLSAAHSDEDLRATVAAYERLLEMMQ